MAATTEKYKGTKDGVEINVGGVTININFSTSIEEFNRIGNSTLEENNETKQEYNISHHCDTTIPRVACAYSCYFAPHLHLAT